MTSLRQKIENSNCANYLKIIDATELICVIGTKEKAFDIVIRDEEDGTFRIFLEKNNKHYEKLIIEKQLDNFLLTYVEQSHNLVVYLKNYIWIQLSNIFTNLKSIKNCVRLEKTPDNFKKIKLEDIEIKIEKKNIDENEQIIKLVYETSKFRTEEIIKKDNLEAEYVKLLLKFRVFKNLFTREITRTLDHIFS